MSVCSPCFDAGSYVNACLESFTFGTVPADDTQYFVWLQHNATQKIQQFEVISGVDGYVTMTGIKIDPLQGYTVWVTVGSDSQDKVNITIDGDIYKCLSFSAASIGLSPILIP